MKKPVLDQYILVRLSSEEHAQFKQMRTDGPGYVMAAEKVRASSAFTFLLAIGAFETSRVHEDWYWWNHYVASQLIDFGTYAFLYILVTEDE